MFSKIYYNKKHKSISLKEGDLALLRLHQRYKIQSCQILDLKPLEQFADPFKIIPKVRNLAYHLEIRTHWRIYLVFTIAPSKSCPDPDSDFVRELLRQNNPTLYFLKEILISQKTTRLKALYCIKIRKKMELNIWYIR